MEGQHDGKRLRVVVRRRNVDVVRPRATINANGSRADARLDFAGRDCEQRGECNGRGHGAVSTRFMFHRIPSVVKFVKQGFAGSSTRDGSARPLASTLLAEALGVP